MKSIFILSLGLLFFTACNKKNNKPTEYFSFDVDGVHYNYPLEVTPVGLFGGGAKTLGAGPLSGNLGYDIYAFSQKNPVARGEFRITFPSSGLPNKDTVILGVDQCRISINGFLSQDNDFSYQPPLTGKVIFTERSSSSLKGTFEFDAYKYIPDTSNFGHVIYLDTVIHITNGKFSIIPVQEQA